MLIAASLMVTACNDDDNNTQKSNALARMVLACDMNVNGSDVSYLIPVCDEDLEGGTAALNRA
jgi:hypothetical protein